MATSVARAMNVDMGMVMPNVLCMRFCTSRIADIDIGSATWVSGGGAAAAVSADATDFGAGGGGASLMLLRSRCDSF